MSVMASDIVHTQLGALLADYAEGYQVLRASPHVRDVRIAVGIVPYTN